MIKLVIALVIVWLALMPPLFTNGACTREFDAESARIASDAPRLASSDGAVRYFTARKVAFSVMSLEQCRRAKPRWLASCSGGPIVQARVPVSNPVCSLYRDDDIRVRLLYDERDRLGRVQLEMNPFQSLPLVGGITLHWAR